jgi:hypothetical protein
MRVCTVSGCRAGVSGYGRLCTSHKARDRRHGHPQQEGVTKAQLKPFLKLARGRIKKNAQSALWGQLEARWEALVKVSRDGLAEYAKGTPHVRWDRVAATEIVKLAGDVPARAVIETVIALYLMADYNPRRFRSDRAFLVQLARRVRALTQRNVGMYWDQKDGRSKRVYRDQVPKAAVVLGKWLAEAFGVVGLKVAELERQEADARSAERRALGEALRDLK